MRLDTLIFLLSFTLFTSGLLAQSDTTKKPEFKPSGKVYGYAFGDYYYKMHADSFLRGNTQYAGMPESANSFEFRRVYLGYEFNISERFTTDVLLAYEGTTLSDNTTRTVFVKSANLRWKNIWKNTDMIFGMQATPAWSLTTEKIWGYRSIEKTILDMRRGAGSADLGIGIQGKFDDKGNYGYNFLVANGSGARIEADIFKKFYGNVYAKFLNQKLIIDVFADFERTNMQPRFHKYKNTYKLGIFYTTDAITVGVEAYATTQHNYVIWGDSATAIPDTGDSRVMGVSGYVRGRIIKDKLFFYARYDMYNPDMNFDADKSYFSGSAPVTESFITAGVDFTPHKNVHIMPNIWYNGYASRAKNATPAAKSDFDLVPRLTFWYNFK